MPSFPPLREPVVRGLGLVERERLRDGNLHRARLDQRQHVLLDLARRVGLLLERPRAQRRGHDPPALAHQREQVELRLGPGADADHDDPAAAWRATRRSRRGSARRPARARRRTGRGPRSPPGRSRARRAPRRAGRSSSLRTVRGDVRTRRAAELDRRRAHAARRAVHQQPLAGLEPGLGEEGVVRGREHLRECRRPRAIRRRPAPASATRSWTTAQLRLAAAGDDRHHAVALGKPRRAGPERGDLAGQLEPRDVLGRARAAPGRARAAASCRRHSGRRRGRGRAPPPSRGRGRVLLNGQRAIFEGDGPHFAHPSFRKERARMHRWRTVLGALHISPSGYCGLLTDG